MPESLVIEGRFAQEFREIMAELHEFVSTIQRPKLKDDLWPEAMKDFSDRLNKRISELREELASKKDVWMAELRTELAEKEKAFDKALSEISETLSEYSRELSESRNVRRLHDFYVSLEGKYEELLLELREMKDKGAKEIAKVGHLKPINYPRNLFHMTCGMTAVLMYQFLLTRNEALGILLAIFGVFGTLELTRRFSKRWNDFLVDKVFGLIARPHERHRLNGSTFYVVALILIVWLLEKTSVQAGILVLALADPMAGIFGKLWGKTKLYRNKSWVGTTAFFATACISLVVLFSLVRPELSVGAVVVGAVLTALVGAVVELFSTIIDDNFSVPFFTALAASLLF